MGPPVSLTSSLAALSALADRLLGPVAVPEQRSSLPPAGRGGALGDVEAEWKTALLSAIGGIQHAFQTQLTKSAEESDTTKIVNYKAEVKKALFLA